MCLTRHCRRVSALAACCMGLPNRPANGSCSTAPSASARPWRYRRRRTSVLPRHATSGADSTPGRKPTGRWRADRDAWAPPRVVITLSRCPGAKFESSEPTTESALNDGSVQDFIFREPATAAIHIALSPHSPDNVLSFRRDLRDSDIAISSLFWIARGGDGEP